MNESNFTQVNNFPIQLILSSLTNVQQLKLINGDSIIANISEINLQTHTLILQFAFLIISDKIIDDSESIFYRMAPWFEFGNQGIFSIPISHVIAKCPIHKKGLEIYYSQVEHYLESFAAEQEAEKQSKMQESTNNFSFNEEKKKLN